MLIGYARVSTIDQTLALQQDALTKAGGEGIFTDTALARSLSDQASLKPWTSPDVATPWSSDGWTGWAARYGI